MRTVFWQNALKELTALQTETKETLQTLFPQIPLETDQVRSRWFLRLSHPDDCRPHEMCRLDLLCSVQLAAGVRAESTGGSQPAEPGVSVEQSFTRKDRAPDTFAETGQTTTLTVFLLLQEVLEKLKEAEESHGSLQAECDQYRTVLAETVGH